MNHEKLRNEVESLLGHSLTTSADFEDLSRRIFRKTHEQISPTTIKRIWGYLREDVTPRKGTLDTIAIFCGYRSYQDLLNADDDSQSNEVFSRTLASSDLRVGQQVLLTWPPGRRCVIRYEGYGIFRVIEAHRTKLNSGDTFRCHLMVEHQPLILVELVHNGEKNIQYVAASKDGISFEILD